MDHRNLPWLGFHWQHPIVLLANSFLPLEVRVQLVLQRAEQLWRVNQYSGGSWGLSGMQWVVCSVWDWAWKGCYAGKKVVALPVENWSQIHFNLFTYLFLIGKDISFNTFHFISFKQKNASSSRKNLSIPLGSSRNAWFSDLTTINKKVHSEVSGGSLEQLQDFFFWQLKILSR